MPTYKIASVAPQADYTPEPGRTLKVYAVGLEDAETGLQVVDENSNPIVPQMFMPPDAPPPAIGHILNDRKLNKNKRGYTLKKDEAAVPTQQDSDIASAADKAFGKNGGETDWDAKDRRITRQHSQTLSVEIIKTLGAPDEPEKLRQAIVAWCDWLDADAYQDRR